jgi:DNA-binding CsgD family transcriptional regulator
MLKNLHTFNKIYSTVNKFNEINSRLNKMFGLKFGYTALFYNGSYYKIQSDVECINKIVTNIDNGIIFCDKNITSSTDNFSYLIWPEKSFNDATKIFAHHGYSNAISLIRANKEYFDVFYFAGSDLNQNWQEFFLRNKVFLKEYVQYFEKHRKALLIDEANLQKHLFKFKNGIDIIYPDSCYDLEDQKINHLRKTLLTDIDSMIPPREMQVLHFITKGYSAKLIASELYLSVKTVQHYIENLKKRLGINTKYQLIKYHESLN